MAAAPRGISGRGTGLSPLLDRLPPNVCDAATANPAGLAPSGASRFPRRVEDRLRPHLLAMGNALLRTLKFLLVTQSTPVLFSIPARHDNLDFGMPIRERGPKLFDDTRTFGAAELTEIWAWLDSVDAQTSGARYEAQFSRPPLTF